MILPLGRFWVPALEHVAQPALAPLDFQDGLAWPMEKLHPEVGYGKRGTGQAGVYFRPLGWVAVVFILVHLAKLVVHAPLFSGCADALGLAGSAPLRPACLLNPDDDFGLEALSFALDHLHGGENLNVLLRNQLPDGPSQLRAVRERLRSRRHPAGGEQGSR